MANESSTGVVWRGWGTSLLLVSCGGDDGEQEQRMRHAEDGEDRYYVEDCRVAGDYVDCAVVRSGVEDMVAWWTCVLRPGTAAWWTGASFGTVPRRMATHRGQGWWAIRPSWETSGSAGGPVTLDGQTRTGPVRVWPSSVAQQLRTGSVLLATRYGTNGEKVLEFFWHIVRNTWTDA